MFNKMSTISSLLPSNLAAIDQDIACLKTNSQDWLDVSYLPDKKSFRLVKIDAATKIQEFFNRGLKKERLERLKTYSQNTLSLFENYTWRYEGLIEQFYTQGLAKWDRALFDRTALSEKIQNIVHKKIAVFRESQGTKKRVSPSLSYLPSTEEQVESVKLQAELALKLGVKPQKNKKGVNGSIIYYDTSYKPLGIFKRELTIESWSEWFRTLLAHFFGFRRQNDLCQHEQAHAEIAASIADEVFSIGLVPHTRIVELEGRKGSFMLWEQNVKDAASFDFRRKPTDRELHLFQLMTVYDFLFGNLDRHGENWLVRANKASNQIDTIAMIDNGNSFPEKFPHSLFDYFGFQHMYEWKSHPWAKYPFQETVLDHLRNLSSWKIREFVDKVSSQLGFNFLSGKRLDNFKLRASLLRELHSFANFVPADLGKLRFEKQVEQARSERPCLQKQFA
jgi:hypothetical protein